MDLQKKKADRYKFLLKIYEAVDGQRGYVLDGWEVGKILGFDRDYSTSIFYYLNEEGLVEPMGAGITLGITHQGIKEIEEALSQPDKPTEHFLPVNQYNIHIGTMNGGAIQQATNNSTIHYAISANEVKQIDKFVQELNRELQTLILSEEQKSELRADIQTIEQQNLSPKPKREILKPALLSIKTIIEGTIAGVATNASTPIAQSLIHKLHTLIAALSNT